MDLHISSVSEQQEDAGRGSAAAQEVLCGESNPPGDQGCVGYHWPTCWR